MVYTCFLCKWRSDRHPRRSYHKFPSNEELKQVWLDILGKSNVSIGKRTSLCSLHFEEDCFRYGLVHGTKILKDGSLPTLHLTESDTKDQTVCSFDEIKLSESLTESSLHVPHPTKDDVQVKDSTSELNVKGNQVKDSTSELNVKGNQVKDSTSELNVDNNLVVVPMAIYSTKELFRKSSSLDAQLRKDEVLRLKKKVSSLTRSVKRLRNSKREIKSQLTELKKIARKYEAENKLMRVKIMIGKTISKVKKK